VLFFEINRCLRINFLFSLKNEKKKRVGGSEKTASRDTVLVFGVWFFGCGVVYYLRKNRKKSSFFCFCLKKRRKKFFFFAFDLILSQF